MGMANVVGTNLGKLSLGTYVGIGYVCTGFGTLSIGTYMGIGYVCTGFGTKYVRAGLGT
jgi:hypothetical protein